MSELQHQLDVETITIGDSFELLLGTAVEVCLSDKEAYLKNLEQLRVDQAQKRNDTIVNRLGLYGVREMLEDCYLGHLTNDLTEDEKRPAMRRPEPLDGMDIAPLAARYDRDIQLKIEAFGMSLIDEAFLCLGDDAPAKVDEYKNATNDDERRKVLEWLHIRLRELSGAIRPQESLDQTTEQEITEDGTENTNEPQESNDVTESPPQNFYHPARLSPKLIGKYPNNGLPATCLGISILSSAFIAKTGQPYMHAGMMASMADMYRMTWAMNVLDVEDLAKDLDLELPDDIRKRLRSLRRQGLSTLRDNWGFHAATIFKASDKFWAQIDPNYHATHLINQDTSEILEEVYLDLEELRDSARGVEMIVTNRRMFESHIFIMLLEKLKPRIRTAEEIEQLLIDIPTSVSLEELTYALLADLMVDSEIEEAKYAKGLYNFAVTNSNNNEGDPVLDDVAYFDYLSSSLLRFVFPDAKTPEAIEKSLQRAKSDPNYRRNRVEDIRMLPIYTALSIHVAVGNAAIDSKYRTEHMLLEVGLPEYRIGASVLSDFAVYTNNNLPLSFWLAHWPSHVSFAEHANVPERSDAQQELALQTAESIIARHWTYHNIYGMVRNVLEQEHEGGDKDSHRKG